MWISKAIDIIGAIVYITFLFIGIKLGFKKSLRVFTFIFFITLLNSVVFRIFKHFIAPQHLEVIDVGILLVSSVAGFFIFFPLVTRMFENIKDIEVALVSRMTGFLLFSVNGVFIIGYFVIFTDLYPQLHYILDTSAFLRILSNIVKLIVGIKII